MEGDGRAHVISFTSLSPFDDYVTINMEDLCERPEEYEMILEELNTFVEDIENCNTKTRLPDGYCIRLKCFVQ